MRTIPFQECLALMDSEVAPAIIDLREPAAFADGHLPGSISIPFETGDEYPYTELLPSEGTLLLMGGETVASEFAGLMDAQVNSRILGRMEHGPEGWLKAGRPIDMVVTIAADELAMDLPHDDRILLLDVRTEAEFDEGHVRNAVSVPLPSLTDPGSMAMLEDDCNIYIYGSTSAEAATAASLIKRQGYHNLRTLEDDWETLRTQKGIPVEKTTAPLN
jgi:rhodanese-related sulfurtransferase